MRPVAAPPLALPLALPLVLLLGGCVAHSSPSPPPPAPCGSAVLTGALPEWARTGFNNDGSGTPHVLGRNGDIVGVLFGAPLSAPPAPDRGNKVLWVSRLPAQTGDTLRITAELAGTAGTAEREVPGGPGPSIVDLPRAGCWHLTLRWSGHTDTMDLTYTAPAAPAHSSVRSS